MKRSLKKFEKYFSLHHYLSALRRAPVHMQHLYAALFAGAITMLLAVIILYFDYGFWHDKYLRTEVIETQNVEEPAVATPSPGEMIGNFFKEASEKLKTINVSSTTLPTGKESYSRDEGTADSQ